MSMRRYAYTERYEAHHEHFWYSGKFPNHGWVPVYRDFVIHTCVHEIGIWKIAGQGAPTKYYQVAPLLHAPVAESFVADRLQAGGTRFQMSSRLSSVLHCGWTPWPCRVGSSKSVCGPHRHTHCQFVALDYQPTVTELFQSPQLAYGTICYSMSSLHCLFLSSALVWGHTF